MTREHHIPARLRLALAGLLSVLLLGVGWATWTRALGAAEPSAAAHAPEALILRYRFSGVSDDGAQGGAGRSEATSVHCTNLASSDSQVEVRVYTYNALQMFVGSAELPPNFTYTFSTQNTSIYFDDVILGGGAGTEAIFQGSGEVWSEFPEVICTVQVLDPLGYPPAFVTPLSLYYGDGTPVGEDRQTLLPLLLNE